MPRIGVHLDFPPDGGGTYQYALSVVRGLAPLVEEGWELIAFARDGRWRAALPAGAALVVREEARPWRTAFLAWLKLDRGAERYRRAGRLLPLVRAMDRSGCDLIVFPSQDMASFQTRRPSLVAIHDLMHRYEPRFAEYQGRESAWRDELYAAICRHATGILVDSELGKRHVVESYGRAPGRIFVLPFVPPDYLASAPEVDVRRKYELFDRYLFYPAQFWEHKNHLRLVQALALARGRGADCNLVLVGSRKNAYERVVREIDALGLSSCVRILGYVPNEDMASLYRGAVATVFVSLAGPTNIPPLEAMAMGCPLVLSSAYAMPEQVGDAALLVDARDAAALAAAIERVWSDAALRASLRARGLERSARWTGAHFGAALRDVVRSLAGGSPGPGDADRGPAPAEAPRASLRPPR